MCELTCDSVLFFCPHVTSEMAEKADLWKGLLLDGSDRQGGGGCLALAGRDRTCCHVSIESENLYHWENLVPEVDIQFRSCFPTIITSF